MHEGMPVADLTGWDTRHYLTLLRQQAEVLCTHPAVRHLRLQPADLAAQTLARASDTRTRTPSATAERDRLAWFLRLERDLLTELQKAHEVATGTWRGKPASDVLQALGQALLDSTTVWDNALDANEAKQPTKQPTRTVTPEPASTIEPFDKYTDFELLSQGGMGEVFKCRDMELGRSVAMKLMHAHLATDPDLVRHFNEEAQVAGQLQHPNVAVVHERGRTPSNRPYFTMKLIRGQTLAAAIAAYHAKPTLRGRDQLLKQFVAIAETVEYAHGKNVLHRDLKPLNIMVGAFGEIQVMDWGLSKVLGSDVDHRSNVRTVRTGRPDAETRAGVVRGTFAYMSPEQANADKQAIDHRTDIFALGAILCEILTGRPLYIPRPDAVDRQEELWQMAHTGHTGPAFDRLDACGAPAVLIQLVKKCLEFRPEDRPARAADVANAISDYFASVEADERSSEIQSATHGAQRKARRWQYALGLALIGGIVLGLGAYLWYDARTKARVRTTMQALESALGEVQRLQAEAQQMPTDTPAEARHAAKAWEKCQALVEQSQQLTNIDLIPGPEKEKLQSLTEAIRQATSLAQEKVNIAERNEKLLIALDAAELLAGNRTAEYRPDHDAAHKAFRKAFQDYGVDVLNVPSEDSAAKLRAMHKDGWDALIRGLDFWNTIGHEHKDRPRQTADLLDQNTWRREFRAALITRDVNRLKALGDTRQQIARAVAANEVDLLGAALRQLNQTTEAIRIFKEAEKGGYSSYALYMEHGICLVSKRQPEFGPAAIQFRLATEKNKRSSPAYSNLGLALTNSRGASKDNAENAELAFKRALELQPDNVVALVNLATFYLTVQNNPKHAESYLQEAEKYRPNFHEAKVVLAMCRVLQFRLDDAETILKDLPAEYRNGLMGRTVQLVKATVGMNERESARIANELASNYPHHDIGAYCSILGPLFEGDSVTAAAAAEIVVKEYENVPFWRSLGLVGWAMAEMYLGHLSKAEAHARDAIRLDGNSAHTHQALFQVLLRQGRFTEAESVSKRISELSQGQTIFSLYNSLRQTLFDKGILVIEKQVEQLAQGEGKPDPNFIQLQAELALLKGHVKLAHELYGKFTSTKDDKNGSIVLEKLWSAVQGYEGVTHRTNAARAAVRLAFLEDKNLTEPQRQSLRREALALLKADLAFKTKIMPLMTLIPKVKLFASAERYRRWLIYIANSDDFAPVRRDKLKLLPDDEQAEWQTLWAEVHQAIEQGLSTAKKEKGR